MTTRLIIGLLPVLFLGLLACEKEEALVTNDSLIRDIALSTNKTAVNPDLLPTVVHSFLEEVLWDTYLESAYEIKNRGYQLNMGDETVLYTDLDGTLLEYGGEWTPEGPFGRIHPHGPCHRPGRRPYGRPIATDSLPTMVTDYVAAQYPDDTIRRVKITRMDAYILLLSSRTMLRFDTNGDFVEELTPLHRCHRRCASGSNVMLPPGVRQFIDNHFPNMNVRAACRRGDRLVVFLTNRRGRVILGFDADGVLLFRRR